MLVKNRRRSGGFTLLELLVVVVIIGLLASYVGPRYFAQIGKSEGATARAQIDGLRKALDTYRLDLGRYPTAEEGLVALTKRPAEGGDRWAGPYLSKPAPLDPWGHPYQYTVPGTNGDYALLSLGKDGRPGGTGENADIGD
jgi:general secretion pathway protein G